MGLKQKISEDQKVAMKAGEKEKLSVLRMLSSAISNKEIALQKKDDGLSDEEVCAVISSEVKKRKDSVAEYEKAGRGESAESEKAEAEILKAYLPPEISDDDLVRIVKDGIRESGATSMKDFASVMKTIMPILKGKASGDRISEAVKNEFSG